MIRVEKKTSPVNGQSDVNTGVTLSKNARIKGLCGTKILIESDEILDIPQNYDYNTFALTNDGIIENNGQINSF